MASEDNTSLGAFTIFAWIGGIVGAGIVVYALLNGGNEAPREAQEVASSPAASEETAPQDVTAPASGAEAEEDPGGSAGAAREEDAGGDQAAGSGAQTQEVVDAPPADAPRAEAGSAAGSSGEAEEAAAGDAPVDAAEDDATEDATSGATVQADVPADGAAREAQAGDTEAQALEAEEDKGTEDVAASGTPEDGGSETAPAGETDLAQTETTARSVGQAEDAGGPEGGAALAQDEAVPAEPQTPQTDIAALAPGTAQEVPGGGVTAGTAGEAALPDLTDGPVFVLRSPDPGPTEPGLDPNDPAAPTFDLVRIDADGSAVIAGRAAPNANVQIMRNGEEVATVTASSRGEFVALLDAPVQDAAQSLDLIADAPDGGKVTSQSSVIVLGRTPQDAAGGADEIALAPAIVQTSDEVVRVMQPVVGLADLDRVSLDSISYDEGGQVVLAGRGRPGNVARIYASGSALADERISAGGTWNAVLGALDEGRYVIRVDEIGADGAVLSRVESPFQRIFPTAEQLALLTDASSVIVQPGNNLWRIAERRYGAGIRYTTIFEANREQIRDPDLIYPGQVFELPDQAE